LLVYNHLLLGWDTNWHSLDWHSLDWHLRHSHAGVHHWLSAHCWWHTTWVLLNRSLWHSTWLLESISTLVVVVWCSWASSVLLVHTASLSESTLWLSLKVCNKELDDLMDFGFVHDVHVESSGVLFLKVLVVCLVSNFFLLELSDFL